MKFCPMCGEKIPSSAKFCTGCGLNLVDYQKKLARLSSGEQNQTNPPHTPRGRNLRELIHSLNEEFGDLQNVYFNISNDKNSKKIKSAIKAYAQEVDRKNVIFVFDDTFFGGGEDGFLVTDEKICVHNMDDSPFSVPLNESTTFEAFHKTLAQRILINGSHEIQLSGYSENELDELISLLEEVKAALEGEK